MPTWGWTPKLQCWQGDDVSGFENPGGKLTGRIAVTGNYPGKARTAAELCRNLEVVYSLLHGSHRDPGIRQYWVEHCIASRKIGDYFERC